MKFNKRRIIIIVLILITGIIAFYGIRSFVFSEIHSRIDEKLEALESSGFKVHYDSLFVNWRTNLIQIDQLLLEINPGDTSCIYPEFISIGKLRAEGFNPFLLIFSNALSFDDFYLKDLRVVISENSQLQRGASPQKENDFTFSIDRGFINSVEFTYTDSLHCKKISGMKSNLIIDELSLAFNADEQIAYELSSITLNNTEVQWPEKLYTFKIKKTKMDFIRRRLRADSIQVIPDGGKIEFGKKHGFEIDRYDALIPFINAHDFSFSFIDSSIVSAGLVEIQFYLKIFRDKRLPFVKKQKLLPVARLRDLPFNLLIDSLKITKSYVAYEEFVEGASEPGKVYFDNLYTSLYNIDSRSKTGSTKLRAKGNLFGQGSVDLSVNLPLDTRKRSTVSGSIVNFSLPKINSMLTPSTNIKVESGKMEKLLFSFTFDKIRSDGEIELNYEDLKLVIFKEEEDNSEEPEKNNLKTFIMNTFIFRTNMNEGVPEEKRTGTIGYVRDNNRSIFNFWVKSLVSGIKSAYNLDKGEAKRDEREIKRKEREIRKEQQLSRREARKRKRAEKKKERG